MNCPACQEACNKETYENVNIDVCSKCKGVWLEKGELDQIVKRREKIFKSSQVAQVNRLCGSNGTPKEEDSRKLSCPHCNSKPMKTFNYNYSSGIIVDRCPKGCGIWLDAEELDKIQIHSELWQDKLEANRDRFEMLAGQVEADAGHAVDDIDDAISFSRSRFINTIVRGLVRFDG